MDTNKEGAGMSTRSAADRNLYGAYGIGAKETARTIRAHVRAHRDTTDGSLEALRGLADSMADQYGALLLGVFDREAFMRSCGF